MKKAVAEIRRGHREDYLRPKSDNKACRRRATVKPNGDSAMAKPVILKSRLSLILRGHYEVFRRPKNDNEAYLRSNELLTMKLVGRLTMKLVIKNFKHATAFSSKVGSMCGGGRRVTAKPIVLKSNLNRSRSRTSSMQQLSRQRFGQCVAQAVTLPQDIVDLAAEDAMKAAILMGLQRSMENLERLKKHSTKLKKIQKKVTTAWDKMDNALAERDKASRDLSELQKGGLGSSVLAIFDCGWNQELGTPLDLHVWTTAILPNFPEKYSPMILLVFNEEEYMN
ncbi:hypothetical protein Acr_23g0008590 [Actinidia rufa]|uniref:Uncharacterized protein n=1 Tax=Actinidia rufa TaxID=165716 RepID=A0A7J0GPC0_9ERIC|nr:hypothetical protein Acr_23g0008590 [Actinidia rufa]